MKKTRNSRWRWHVDARRSKRCRGTVSVEMALVAPFIFLMVFSAVEFARMMMIRQALTNAARDGCRHACLVTTLDSDSVDDAVRDNLLAVIANASATSSIRVKVDPSFSVSPDSGTSITTTVEVDCADVSWLPPFFTAQSTIRGTASMKRE